MGRKAVVGALILGVGVTLGVVLFHRVTQAGYTVTSGTLVQVTQVRPISGAGTKNDPRIPKNVMRALLKKYMNRYSKYKLEDQNSRDAKLSQEEEFVLVNGQTITIEVTSYVPNDNVIHIKIRRGEDISVMSIPSGTQLVYLYEEEDKTQKPLIVVIGIALLQVRG